MARYRVKDDVDLRWNKIRRRITREVDLQIADFREELLNRLLGQAWQDYADAISSGRVLELEAQYESTFVKQALAEVVDVEVEREAA